MAIGVVCIFSMSTLCLAINWAKVVPEMFGYMEGSTTGGQGSQTPKYVLDYYNSSEHFYYNKNTDPDCELCGEDKDSNLHTTGRLHFFHDKIDVS